MTGIGHRRQKNGGRKEGSLSAKSPHLPCTSVADSTYYSSNILTL